MSEYIYATQGKPVQDENGLISLARERIVRCGDCKRWESGDCDWNPYHDDPVDDQPDGFCSWACRKEQ